MIVLCDREECRREESLGSRTVWLVPYLGLFHDMSLQFGRAWTLSDTRYRLSRWHEKTTFRGDPTISGSKSHDNNTHCPSSATEYLESSDFGCTVNCIGKDLWDRPIPVVIVEGMYSHGIEGDIVYVSRVYE